MNRRFEPDLRSMIIAFVVITLALTMWSLAGKEMKERAGAQEEKR